MTTEEEQESFWKTALSSNDRELVTALMRRCEILTATNESLTDDLLQLRAVKKSKSKNKRSNKC